MRSPLAQSLAALCLAGLSLAVVPNAASAAVPSCHGRAVTILGTPGDDRLVGTHHRDVIWGGPGADVILAAGGSDLVCGGEGTDRIFGQGGDDRLYGGQDGLKGADPTCLVGDRLDGGLGDDLLDPGRDARRPDQDCRHRVHLEWLQFNHGQDAVQIDLTRGTARGQGHDRLIVEESLQVTGSDGDDVIVGSPYGDRLRPRGGKDVVRARGGSDDVVDGVDDTGSDVFNLGSGNDFSSSSGRDRIRGGPGWDAVFISGGPAHVSTGAGDDELDSGGVRDGDTFSGGPGDDKLVTIEFGRKIVLDIAAGIFRAHEDQATAHLAGFETYQLFSGRPVHVQGSNGADTVSGGLSTRIIAHMAGGDDRVETGSESDLYESKDDYVDGGDGTDYAALGTGSDICENVEEGPC